MNVLYSELKDEREVFIIRVAPNTQMETIIQHGSVKLDAKLWKDEYIFKTNLNFEDVSNLPFVLSVKSL